jgi:hypothetical protein
MQYLLIRAQLKRKKVEVRNETINFIDFSPASFTMPKCHNGTSNQVLAEIHLQMNCYRRAPEEVWN